MSGRILASGGSADLDAFALSLAAKPRPRVCYLPTAAADDPARIVGFYERFGPLDCEPTHLRLFGMPEKPAAEIARADVVLVAGGSTANMLAIWRVHGILSGSFCPHYDGEDLRRPVYTRLVREAALPPGIACDDDAAALYEGAELTEVVAPRPGARACRVTADGEEALEARLL